jgi:hypothetical protein
MGSIDYGLNKINNKPEKNEYRVYYYFPRNYLINQLN